MKKALLVGASGLIGTSCLDELLKDDYFSEVEIWVRKPMGISHPKLIENIIEFSQINNIPKIDADMIFCCLGTTIKTAGTKEAFRKVDYEYVVEIGKLTERSNSEKYLVVSSLGANKNSGNFYLRTKGEMEESLKGLSIPSILLFRPSMLFGKRKEFRLGELIIKPLTQFLGLFLFGKLKKYRGIYASTVAKAMVVMTKQEITGITILESDKIQDLGS